MGLAIGIGIGIPFTRRTGDPALVLDLDFSGTAPPSIFAGIYRTGVGGEWKDDGTLGLSTQDGSGNWLMRQEIHPAIAEAVRGVLGEPQVTNGFWNSPWVGGATPTAWSLTGAAPTVETSLHGTSDGAIALEFTASAAQSYVYQAFNIASNTTYAISCFIESVTGTVRADDIIDYAASLPAGCSVLSYYLEGVAATAATTATVGRLTMVIGGTSYIGTSQQFRFGCGTNAAATGTVRLSRPQIEASAYATSWIATPTSGTATRTTDPRLTYTLPAAVQTALATRGTRVVTFAFIGAGSAANADGRTIAALYADANNYLRIYNRSGNVGVACVTASGVEYAQASAAPVDAYDIVKVAFRWDDAAGTARACVNGTLLTAVGSGFDMFTPTTLSVLGSFTGSATAGAIVFDDEVYTRAMSDAEMQAVTT